MCEKKRMLIYYNREELSHDLRYWEKSDTEMPPLTAEQECVRKNMDNMSQGQKVLLAYYAGEYKAAIVNVFGRYEMFGDTMKDLVKKSELFYQGAEFYGTDMILLLGESMEFIILVSLRNIEKYLTRITSTLNKYLYRYLDENGITAERMYKMLRSYADIGIPESEGMDRIRKAVAFDGSLAVNDGFKILYGDYPKIYSIMPKDMPSDTIEEIVKSAELRGIKTIPGTEGVLRGTKGKVFSLLIDNEINREMVERRNKRKESILGEIIKSVKSVTGMDMRITFGDADRETGKKCAVVEIQTGIDGSSDTFRINSITQEELMDGSIEILQASRAIAEAYELAQAEKLKSKEADEEKLLVIKRRIARLERDAEKLQDRIDGKNQDAAGIMDENNVIITQQEDSK